MQLKWFKMTEFIKKKTDAQKGGNFFAVFKLTM